MFTIYKKVMMLNNKLPRGEASDRQLHDHIHYWALVLFCQNMIDFVRPIKRKIPLST